MSPEFKRADDPISLFLKEKTPSKRRYNNITFGHLLTLRFVERGEIIPERVRSFITTFGENVDLQRKIDGWNVLEERSKSNPYFMRPHKTGIMSSICRSLPHAFEDTLRVGLENYQPTLDEIIDFISASEAETENYGSMESWQRFRLLSKGAA